MKRKSYYFLFVLYILMLGFILYINGVFTGEIGSISNFAINLAFFHSDRYSDDYFRCIFQPVKSGR